MSNLPAGRLVLRPIDRDAARAVLDGGAVVGEIGAVVDGSTAQVGYTVVEPSWGQGYATEALRALLGHLLADPRIEREGSPQPERGRRAVHSPLSSP